MPSIEAVQINLIKIVSEKQRAAEENAKLLAYFGKVFSNVVDYWSISERLSSSRLSIGRFQKCFLEVVILLVATANDCQKRILSCILRVVDIHAFHIA